VEKIRCASVPEEGVIRYQAFSGLHQRNARRMQAMTTYGTEKPRGGDPWKLIWGAFLQRALKHTDLMAQSQVFQLEVNS